MTVENRVALSTGKPVGTSPSARVPGEIGLWVFLIGDLFQFGAFFAYFGYQHARHLVEFEAARDTLSVGQGVLNTVLLLSSSVFVATGLDAYRGARSRRNARKCFVVAGLLGVGFVISKCVEYADEFAHGTTITSGDFYALYFAYTGIHLLHVFFGLAFLALAWWRMGASASAPSAEDRRAVESVALFWHFVDLIWVVLFAQLYLI